MVPPRWSRRVLICMPAPETWQDIRSGRIWLGNNHIILTYLDHVDWLWFEPNRFVYLLVSNLPSVIMVKI